MFAVWVLVNHHLVACIVGAFNAFGVFTSVVLDDESLLAVFDALPVSLEQYVEDGIAVKH